MSRPTRLLSGNTLYWTIRLYDDSQVLVDADSTPTVAVRKNGASTADAVTVTKRAATTGIYDCSYNPAGEAEGDQYTLEESATVSAVVYENSWTVVVAAVERGTDGANTVAPDNASISAILADTSDLQANQGQWLTATSTTASNAPTNWSLMDINASGEITTSNPASGGGSNHTAEDVRDLILAGDKTPITMATNSVSNVVLVDTTTTNTDMRGTDGANTVTPNTVAPDNASIAAILVDTADLQANQNNWLTATSTIASNAPANWSIMDINGSGEITTSNPASGGGSAHTAEDVRDLILAGDKTPIAVATGSVSNVILVNTTTVNSDMRGTDGANTVTPNTVAPDNTSIAAILADTGELQTKIIPMLEDDGAGSFQYTTLSLENAPSGGSGSGGSNMKAW